MFSAENKSVVAPPQSKEKSVIEALDDLRTKLNKPSNRPMTYADVRDDHSDIAGYIFSGRNLQGVKLDGTDLERIDFQGSDLSHSTFKHARIRGAVFDMCKLARSKLRQADDWQDHVKNHVWQQRRGRFRRFPGDRFSCAPYLSELIMLPAEIISVVQESDLPERRDLKLLPDEYQALLSGNLAIALTPVCELEHNSVIGSNRHVDRQGRTDPFELNSTAARAFVEKMSDFASADIHYSSQARAVPFRRVAIPSLALLNVLRLNSLRYKGGVDSLEPGDATDLQVDCLAIAKPDKYSARPEFGRPNNYVVKSLSFSTTTRWQKLEDDSVTDCMRAYLRPVYFFDSDEDKHE